MLFGGMIVLSLFLPCIEFYRHSGTNLLKGEIMSYYECLRRTLEPNIGVKIFRQIYKAKNNQYKSFRMFWNQNV